MPTLIDADDGGGPIWNVEERIGIGSTGDDVRLVQYLVARYGMWEGTPGSLTVDEVDGVWGPKTAAAFLIYERTATSVVTNGFVYPVKKHTDFLHLGVHGFLHHIVSLQEYYCAIISGKPVGGIDSRILMEIGEDGMCPGELAFALKTEHEKGGHSHGHSGGGGAGQSDFFLKIDGVEGESQDDKHKNEIHITSFSIKASNAGSGHSGKGSGVGKAHVHDIDVTKEVDKASPNIFLNCLTGKHHPKATIIARKAGEKPHEYLKITLEEVFISEYQLNAKKDGQTPVESFSLNFASVEQEHKVQNADGSAGAANKKKFEMKKHKSA